MEGRFKEHRSKKIYRGMVRVGRRILLHFLIAMVPISTLAGLQLLVLYQIPGWRVLLNKTDQRRLIDLEVLGNCPFAVATIYYFGRFSQIGFDVELKAIRRDNLDETANYCPKGMIWARLSPCGAFIAALNPEGSLQIYSKDNLDTPIEWIEQKTERVKVRSLWWSPDSSRLLILDDKLVWIWDRSHQAFIGKLSIDRDSEITQPESGQLFCFTVNNNYQVYNWNGEQVLERLPVHPQATNVSISNDLKIVAFTVGSEIHAIEVDSERSLLPSDIEARSLSLSGDGRYIAYLHFDLNSREFSARIIEIVNQIEWKSPSLGSNYMSGIQFSGEAVWIWGPSGMIRKWLFTLPSNDPMSLLVTNITEEVEYP